MVPTPKPAPVVIAGGGFGGLTTALALAAHKQHPPILLIEPQERFLFLPLLYELLSGELRRWEVAPRYDALLAGRGVAWLRDRVAHIDTAGHSLQTDSGRQVAYSRLVLATGGRSDDFGIPGVAEHALNFRSLADVERLHELIQRLKQRQRPLQRLVVVGAGPSGVELICKLADLLEGSTILELVEQGPELLPNSRSFNRDQARSALLRRDIHLRTGTRVEGIDASGLELVRGGAAPMAGSAPMASAEASPARQALPGQRERLPADAVIWTAGMAANLPPISPAPERDRRGRVVCQSDLQVTGLRDVFSLGDGALCGDDQPPLPATAQVAYQQAQQLAANLMLSLADQPLKPFQWNDLGEMVGLGIGQASLTGLGITLAGPAAFQIRQLAYLARMPGLSHQLRVAAGWLADWR
jgi:NADH:ubiquinone reductase (non-electrogenic)